MNDFGEKWADAETIRARFGETAARDRDLTREIQDGWAAVDYQAGSV